ncbi:hypothetical protein ACINWC141_2002 [Acinetobacter sp. WC-141]|nr:hypothetical protein ACINWC141_2002 [Acinetobacter sp. WC-141]
MLSNLRQIFCIHIWEYDFDIAHDEIKECRKCGKIHKMKSFQKLT